MASLPLPLLKSFAGLRVLVMGDAMLDRFVHGRTERMSPEAPVPILVMTHEHVTAGGAGNVVRNIASLGGAAHLITVIGDDEAGARLRDIFSGQSNVSAELITLKGRRTTEKTRFVSDRQQLLRVDAEDASPVEAALAMAGLTARLDWADIVILSDYAKGFFSNASLAEIIARIRAAGKRVIVDPKSADAKRYDGAFLLTPNCREAALASGIAGEGDEACAQAASVILDAAPGIEAVLVTRGARGMTLLPRGGDPMHLFTSAREVFDVSGAGDTVVAALALALGAGCSLSEAASVANQAAGLAVAKSGTATVGFDELIAALEENSLRGLRAKIVTLNQALDQVARWRSEGQRIGFTNGCFDLIHPGHIALLTKARAACRHLIVGINTDASVRRLKGPGRPLQGETARALVMAGMQAADLVVLFDEDTPIELIKAIRPDVLIKGADYAPDQVVGGDFVASYGGELVLVEMVAGESSSGAFARMAK